MPNIYINQHIPTLTSRSSGSIASTPWIPETDLLRRVENADPTVTEVRMWEARTVDVPPGQRRDVFTCSLAECIAVAIASKHGDGTRSVSLSHFPPTSTERQLEKLEQALQSTSHDFDNPRVLHKIFVITPGEYKKDQAGDWKLIPKQHTHIDDIKNMFGAYLPDIAVQLCPYSEMRSRHQSSAFALHVPAKVEEPIRYEGIVTGQCGF